MDDKEKQKFREHYSALTNESLLELSNGGETGLVAGAYELLLEELKKRGINDIADEKKKANEERLKEENERKVELEPYASSGKRFLNWMIDLPLSMALAFPFVILFYKTVYFIIGREGYKVFAKIIGNAGDYVLFYFFLFLYYFIFESTIQRTPAKFLTKTKVLDINNTKPTKKQIFIRTLSRFVPIEMLSGFGKPKWIGWHDSWSHTKVVKSNFPNKI